MLNEHDLADWENIPLKKPLYSIPRNTYIEINGIVLWFDHLDGMYSYCTTLTGDVVHLGATTLVSVLEKK